jgi:hypothetical protein
MFSSSAGEFGAALAVAGARTDTKRALVTASANAIRGRDPADLTGSKNVCFVIMKDSSTRRWLWLDARLLWT